MQLQKEHCLIYYMNHELPAFISVSTNVITYFLIKLEIVSYYLKDYFSY